MTDDKETVLNRAFNLELVKKSGSKIVVEASSNECKQLAKLLDIPDVIYLKADCSLGLQTQNEIGDYWLQINMEAKIIQLCGVTLTEVEELIKEDCTIIFLINHSDTLNPDIDFHEIDDDIEIISHREIDVGIYISEYLSLSMNPYPRQEGAKGDELGVKILNEEEATTNTNKKSPFDVLKTLKHKT
jgi:uncharacterized metal-binding protein YceD (DUF177 family)